MDYSFSSEQLMLRDSIAKYLNKNYDFEKRRNILNQNPRGFSAENWSFFAEMGLLSLPFSEEQGGLGGSVVDVVLLAQEFGRHLVLEPYVSSTLFAAQALALSDNQPLKTQWLPGVLTGEHILALAHEESPSVDGVAVSARLSGDTFVLNGEKCCALHADMANALVITAGLESGQGDGKELGLFLLQRDQLEVMPYELVDNRGAADLRLRDVEVSEASLIASGEKAEQILQQVLMQGLLAVCAEATGAVEQLLKTTVEYANTRKQFGGPLTQFQTLRHRLAEMTMSHRMLYATLLATTAKVAAGEASSVDISILKGLVGRLGRFVAQEAVQIHGGIGTTDEISVGHYLKRLLVIDALFGNVDSHFRKVGAAVNETAENNDTPGKP